jgi:hypothetical protein
MFEQSFSRRNPIQFGHDDIRQQ